jgi:hypothetical protein
MSLSKGKCWYSNNRLHFLKRAVPFCQKHGMQQKSFYGISLSLEKSLFISMNGKKCKILLSKMLQYETEKKTAEQHFQKRLV